MVESKKKLVLFVLMFGRFFGYFFVVSGYFSIVMMDVGKVEYNNVKEFSGVVVRGGWGVIVRFKDWVEGFVFVGLWFRV